MVVSKPPGDGHYPNANRTLSRVNDILEARSKRIAHALHDEAGQILAAVFIRLDKAARELPPSCGSCFQELKQMLELIELQLRQISHDLRPTVLDDLGLVPALQGLIGRVSQGSGIKVVLACSVPERLTPSLETALYRVVQEWLQNIAEHKRASRVEIRLSRVGQQVRTSIRDNDVWFDRNAVLPGKGTGNSGLMGIRQRVESVGGTLSVHSGPGTGTKLVIDIPEEQRCRLV